MMVTQGLLMSMDDKALNGLYMSGVPVRASYHIMVAEGPWSDMPVIKLMALQLDENLFWAVRVFSGRSGGAMGPWRRDIVEYYEGSGGIETWLSMTWEAIRSNIKGFTGIA